MITDDISKFGNKELAIVAKMFNSCISHGFPDNFEFSNIGLRLDTRTGDVYFTNIDGRCAMLNGSVLDVRYVCEDCEQEGFVGDMGCNDGICDECDESLVCEECGVIIDYLEDSYEANGSLLCEDCYCDTLHDE